jgi:hypothetical protein
VDAPESEAVGTLQSILGPETTLTIEETGETILVTNQATDATWSFRPVQVGRLDRNQVAHQVNTVEDMTSKNPDGTAGTDAPLLIADYVTPGAAEFLRQEGISYLDASGNCFLQSGTLLLFVEGQKPKNRGQRKSIRAFNASGLKLIFLLLVREDVINRTYRDLAALVDISQGTVAYVMQDLKDLNFVEERGKNRILRKREDLMDRWATGYTERLRSNLSRGRFRFVEDKNPPEWQKSFSDSDSTRWGGEPGADLLTGNFRPELLTLYTREDTSTVCQELGAAPDPEGSIEIMDLFWDPVALDTPDAAAGSTMEHVPPLLIYADLVASADPRARRVAKTIWDQYLVADAT